MDVCGRPTRAQRAELFRNSYSRLFTPDTKTHQMNRRARAQLPESESAVNLGID